MEPYFRELVAKNCVNEIENNENNKKSLLRKRKQRERTMSSHTADSSTTYDATNQTDYFENVDEVTPYPAIRHQLHRNYSLNNHDSRYFLWLLLRRF